MFQFCTDPATLGDAAWMACYLTTAKHMSFYLSFVTVLVLLAVTAPVALAFGLGGAVAARSHVAPLRWLGKIYIAMVRGIPDIVFFMFFVIALDQGLEWLNHQVRCPDWTEPIRNGNEFRVCPEAKIPQGSAAQMWHEVYGFALAVFTFAIVFGAFAAKVMFGAMRAVPRGQIETAEAYGMTPRQAFRRILLPQMWTYALPGLSNLWQILVKATPLLFLLGVEDIVDTGLTMRYLLHYLEGRGPLSVRVASLLSKPSRRQVEVPVHYLGFEIEDAFVYGYGLDVAHRYRNLPFVTSMSPDEAAALGE